MDETATHTNNEPDWPRTTDCETDEPLDPRIRRIAEVIGRQIAREYARGLMPYEETGGAD